MRDQIDSPLRQVRGILGLHQLSARLPIHAELALDRRIGKNSIPFHEHLVQELSISSPMSVTTDRERTGLS